MTEDTEARRNRTAEQPASRAEETQAARRKRTNDVTQDPTLRRFGVTDDFIDTEKYYYFAAVDDKTRLLELTKDDDYDFITDKGAKADKPDAAGVLRYQSGVKLDGSPQYTYLLRKPKQFADEDRAKKVAKNAAEERALLANEPGSNRSAPDKSYTPKR